MGGHLSLEELVGDTIRICTDALPKANVASENRPSQKEVSSSNHLFSGAKMYENLSFQGRIIGSNILYISSM